MQTFIIICGRCSLHLMFLYYYALVLLLVWSGGSSSSSSSLNLGQYVQSHNTNDDEEVCENSSRNSRTITTKEDEFVQLLREGDQAIEQGDQSDDVIEKMMWKAYEMIPTRAEPLHVMMKYYRKRDQYAKAYVFAQAAKSIPYAEEDFWSLYSQDYNADYAYRTLEEIGIVSYYIGNYDEGYQANLEILHWYENGLFIEHNVIERIRENLQYYEGKALKSVPAFPRPIKSVKVDMTYYINLDDRIERRNRMDSILDKLGFVPYQRFPAVGPKSTSMSMSMDEYIKHHAIQPSTDYEQSRGYTVSHGEIGCFMSHYSVLQDIIEKGYNVSIVFEDDVSFMPQFHSILPAVLEELEELEDDLSWDVILLGRKRRVPGEEKRVPGSNYLVHPRFSLWAVGYLVSLTGAAKIIQSKPLSRMVPFDDLLYFLTDSYPRRDLMDKISFNPTLNLLAVKPGLVSGSDDSDTRPGQTVLK